MDWFGMGWGGRGRTDWKVEREPASSGGKLDCSMRIAVGMSVEGTSSKESGRVVILVVFLVCGCGRKGVSPIEFWPGFVSIALITLLLTFLEVHQRE